jgi:hypothetical protein
MRPYGRVADPPTWSTDARSRFSPTGLHRVVSDIRNARIQRSNHSLCQTGPRPPIRARTRRAVRPLRRFMIAWRITRPSTGGTIIACQWFGMRVKWGTLTFQSDRASNSSRMAAATSACLSRQAPCPLSRYLSRSGTFRAAGRQTGMKPACAWTDRVIIPAAGASRPWADYPCIEP